MFKKGYSTASENFILDKQLLFGKYNSTEFHFNKLLL